MPLDGETGRVHMNNLFGGIPVFYLGRDPLLIIADPSQQSSLFLVVRDRVSEPEPEYMAEAGAVTLARLWLHLKYLLNNSRKLYGT